MGETLTYKILRRHLVEGSLTPGESLTIRIDQTLTQDATGTLAFLEFEALGKERVATELSVSYVDHNLSQFGPENHNDHLYLQSIAAKSGVYFSRPGNGICHQVHLERFGRPGHTLLGADSHTPTNGGLGMLAIGTGGLEVALAMAGEPFKLEAPRVLGIKLTGQLPPWVSAKDVILHLLSILTTKGNRGWVLEYFGPGVRTLSVPERATIANMGAETGVLTSIFPADERTREFLQAQGRVEVYEEWQPDPDATYGPVVKRLHLERDAPVLANLQRYCPGLSVSAPDREGGEGFVTAEFGSLEVDLSALEPLAATPASPDNIQPVRELAGTPVQQVVVGSCTNSSYRDLMLVARVLEGRHIHPQVSFAVAPGSRQVYLMLARSGALTTLLRAGARLLETACGPCIGQGFSPGSGQVSLRTFNRNFPGRSGTKNDQVYLVSPEVAVAAALTGEFTDPRDLPRLLGVAYPRIEWPQRFVTDDALIIPPLPPEEAERVAIHRGPTIGKPPRTEPLPESIEGQVLLKLGDGITTDHILPAGPFLKHRSNIPQYAQAAFLPFNQEGQPTFADRALALRRQGRQGIVVGGESYGQGSSREHAALCPAYLGVRVKIVKSLERIHRANLVNFGIVPLFFRCPEDYERLQAGDDLRFPHLRQQLQAGGEVGVQNLTQGYEFTCTHDLTEEEVAIVLAGGKLNYVRERRRL